MSSPETKLEAIGLGKQAELLLNEFISEDPANENICLLIAWLIKKLQLELDEALMYLSALKNELIIVDDLGFVLENLEQNSGVWGEGVSIYLRTNVEQFYYGVGRIVSFLERGRDVDIHLESERQGSLHPSHINHSLDLLKSAYPSQHITLTVANEDNKLPIWIDDFIEFSPPSLRLDLSKTNSIKSSTYQLVLLANMIIDANRRTLTEPSFMAGSFKNKYVKLSPKCIDNVNEIEAFCNGVFEAEYKFRKKYSSKTPNGITLTLDEDFIKAHSYKPDIWSKLLEQDAPLELSNRLFFDTSGFELNQHIWDKWSFGFQY